MFTVPENTTAWRFPTANGTGGRDVSAVFTPLLILSRSGIIPLWKLSKFSQLSRWTGYYRSLPRRKTSWKSCFYQRKTKTATEWYSIFSGVYPSKEEIKDSKVSIVLNIFLKANPHIKIIISRLDNYKNKLALYRCPQRIIAERLLNRWRTAVRRQGHQRFFVVLSGNCKGKSLPWKEKFPLIFTHCKSTNKSILRMKARNLSDEKVCKDECED